MTQPKIDATRLDIVPAPSRHVVHTGDAGDLFLDPVAYRHALEVAGTIATSELIPKHLRSAPSVLIAMAMARRLREDPFVVMQHIHVVHGKAGFSAQYMIARANASGVFAQPITWVEEGQGDAFAVTARATLRESGVEVSFRVPMSMAKSEGWANNNPKYRSMPGLMLRYRSATFLIRLHAPEIMLGFQTTEELRDVIDADEVPNVDRRPVTLTPDDPTPSSPPPTRGIAGAAAALDAVTGASSTPTPTSTPSSPPPTHPGTGGVNGPTSSSSTPSTPTPEELAAERNGLLIALRELSKGIPDANRDALKREHGLRTVGPRSDLVKLRALVAACRDWVTRNPAPTAPSSPPPTTTEPPEQSEAELVEEIERLEALLDDASAFAAVEEAGLELTADGAPDLDNATPEAVRAYRDALYKRRPEPGAE